ncbi:hypothetical protein DENSPDRAFT_404091 [Dentipellis sp. KUC8613]|nr:hypothetical protein DENSPDRAFT_404091 [Dentipellis sp. KUC8613]
MSIWCCASARQTPSNQEAPHGSRYRPDNLVNTKVCPPALPAFAPCMEVRLAPDLEVLWFYDREAGAEKLTLASGGRKCLSSCQSTDFQGGVLRRIHALSPLYRPRFSTLLLCWECTYSAPLHHPLSCRCSLPVPRPIGYSLLHVEAVNAAVTKQCHTSRIKLAAPVRLSRLVVGAYWTTAGCLIG